MFAIDYDGTIADTNLIKSRWILRHLGLDVPSYYCDHSTCRPMMSPDAHRRMSEDVYSESCTVDTPPVAGAIEAIRSLSRIGPIHIVTVRQGPELTWARSWLERYGILDCMSSIVCSIGQQKTVLATDLGCHVMIDDDLKHLPAPPKRLLRIHLRSGIPEPMRRLDDGALLCPMWDDAARAAIEYARSARP